MVDFPKQYKQTKIFFSPSSWNNHPFFFLPEQHTNALDIQQLFRLFLLDALHMLYFWEHFEGNIFLPCSISQPKENIWSSLLKKQIKQFWLSSFLSWFSFYQDMSFQFLLQQFFAEHIRKWTFFEDRFLVYRSPKYQTPISSDLVHHIPTKKSRYTIKYFVSTKNHSLDIITDTPETIFGDVAIAIHPQHKKAKALKGQEAIIPIINKTIPIIIDERADFTRYWWVYRVTPGHDKVWLAIAKDHNLSIDTYAIDKDGYFTEKAWIFAKKPVEEFFSNIIQSLSDIWNLTSTETFSTTIPVHQESGEHVLFRNWKWFFAKLPEETIQHFFEQTAIASLWLSREYIDSTYWLASSHQPGGIPIPLWSNEDKTFIVDSFWLQEGYKKQWIREGLGFWLFLLHCLSTNILPSHFSVEDFITMIFDYQEKEPFSNLFATMQTFFPETKKEFDQLNKAILNLDKEKSLEKNIDYFLEILDTTPCLQKWAFQKYSFAFEHFDPEMKNISHSDQVISHEFAAVLLFLRKIQLSMQHEPLLFCTKENTLKTSLKNILFTEFHLGKSCLEKVIILPSLQNEKGSQDFPVADIPLSKSYYPDCIRIALLSLSGTNNPYTKDIFDTRDWEIAKFWNACRYIKTALFADKKIPSFKVLQQSLEKDIANFSAFDSWILSKFMTLWEEYQQFKNTPSIGTFVRHVFDFIHQDFSAKYLELIKSAPSTYSHNIALYIIGWCISLLRIYLPSLTTELSKIFWFSTNFDTEWFLQSFTSIQKNYSISLFMEIIDKFTNIKSDLWLKKHDTVELFIRSNPDFIRFAKNNEPLFTKTLHAENVLYLVHHEEVPCGYKKEDIIDISIGLKAAAKKSISGIHLLQKQLQEKEEYLQHLKHLVQQMSSSGGDNVLIQQKKEEIASIKKEIEEISFEISKCKMKE